MDWEAFYNSVGIFKTVPGASGTLNPFKDQSRLGSNPIADPYTPSRADPIGVFPTRSELFSALGLGNKTPSGQIIEDSGSESTDFLNRILGTSPLAGDVKDVDGNPVAPLGGETSQIGSVISGIEGTFARIAIIVLGFIFVAVGLSMFKSPVLGVLTGKT